jgi:hypothetical protein
MQGGDTTLLAHKQAQTTMNGPHESADIDNKEQVISGVCASYLAGVCQGFPQVLPQCFQQRPCRQRQLKRARTLLLLLLMQLRQPVALILQEICSVSRRAWTLSTSSCAVWICSCWRAV